MNPQQVLLELLGGISDLAPLSGVDSRRKELRIPQEPELVRIATIDGEYLPVVAQVANLSKSGIGLLMSRPLPLLPGTPLVVELRSLLITGIVRYSQLSKTGTGPFGLGLEISSAERIFYVNAGCENGWERLSPALTA